jgi:hemerythrin-like domain-containing protein
MRPTAELEQEHRAIETMLAVLEEVAERLERGNEVDPQDIERMLEFLTVFADRCHHGKEEDRLFPAMERASATGERERVDELLAELLGEHERARIYVGDMSYDLARYRNKEDAAATLLAVRLDEYVALLREHIRKEDDVLYPIAETRLTPETERELAAAFETIERERIGPGRHEAFHELLQELQQVYVA